ncbi:sulfotransferase family protein [Fulvivirga sedimenti]|uniref:Sulfotransferase n=1 Tax=Fulvivirga sedimenti TaxID=2879465 RepID=A0A9X1L0A0_9BACT|nr:sulfotransferase [Fulvivirga sedimenti]MCA6075616.1 sulfotransferase [Fulvivirga sedimenti]
MNPDNAIRSEDYKKQPLWFKGINALWGATYPLGTKSVLKKDSLIKAARKSTGLEDLGSDFWDEPLERMIDSIQQEARLHPIGQFITRQRIINLLSVRLRAEEYFKKYPEILEQDVYPAMIIVGLQRTGTTKLQRLLAADPENRSVLSWEAINPAPIKNDVKSGEERIKIAKTSVKALQLMSPGFFAIHPVEYEAPEEDVLLLDVSFLSTTAEATMHVPSYASWLEKTDQSPAYAYMMKLLKLLQWQRPGKRWVLKTPHHLEFLPQIKKHFNDVHLIWPHRDVHQSIPSFLSMVAYSRSLFSNMVRPEEVAEHWVRKVGYMLDQALAFRKDGNEAMFTDIQYEDLVKDSTGVLKQIYYDRGLAVSDELAQIFENTALKNPPGKYGKHAYRLSDFGMENSDLDRYTSAYQEFQKTLNGR